MMKYPKSKEIESKIKITLIFTNQIDLAKLRDDIYAWAAEQGVDIFWITSFLNSQDNEQGAWVYFEEAIDATAFKLWWL